MQASNLSGYYADVEYNRKQNGEVKTMIDDEMRTISITPDVIVHSRGENVRHDNLIVVEMKKTERPDAEKDSDRLRLKIMTRQSFDGIWSANGIAAYKTNTIESLNATLGKVSKNRSVFPNDEMVFKLMYPALHNISKRWTMLIQNWTVALNQFSILFDGRVPIGGLNQNSLTQTA